MAQAFTNPFRRMLGARTLECGDGFARVTIDPLPESLLQSRGIVHGGVLAALVDIGAGQAARTLLEEGQTLSTIDLNVSFVRPGATTALIAEGRVLRKGRNVLFGTTDIFGADGALLATGRISMAVRNRGQVPPDG